MYIPLHSGVQTFIAYTSSYLTLYLVGYAKVDWFHSLAMGIQLATLFWHNFMHVYFKSSALLIVPIYLGFVTNSAAFWFSRCDERDLVVASYPGCSHVFIVTAMLVKGLKQNEASFRPFLNGFVVLSSCSDAYRLKCDDYVLTTLV